MNNETTEWNGYAINGDNAELDAIITSPHGMLSLDKNDVESVLSCGGENWVVTAIGSDFATTFDDALKSLPCRINDVKSILISFGFGSKQPIMAEMSSISAALSEANDDLEIRWGTTPDSSLGESYKVVLVASVKA